MGSLFTLAFLLLSAAVLIRVLRGSPVLMAAGLGVAACAALGVDNVVALLSPFFSLAVVGAGLYLILGGARR